MAGVQIDVPSMKSGKIMDDQFKTDVSSKKTAENVDDQSQLLSEIGSDRSQPKSGNDRQLENRRSIHEIGLKHG